MMKTYKKIHKSKEVAQKHMDKIKERGGKAIETVKDGIIVVEYSFPDKKGTIGFVPMDLEEEIRNIARFGGTDVKGVIGILSAMVDAKLTDSDLKTPPTKTGAQHEKAKDQKTKEIWLTILPKYKGDMKGNMYYSTIYRIVENKDNGENLLKKFKPFRKYQK